MLLISMSKMELLLLDVFAQSDLEFEKYRLGETTATRLISGIKHAFT